MLLNSLHYVKSSFTWVFSRSFSVSYTPLSPQWVPLGLSSIGNVAYDTKKLLLETQGSKDFT